MRLLVLGGTAWLGSHIVSEAVARGHDVTALARGESGVVPAGARFVRADRTRVDAFDGLDGEWDAVVDVTRQPGQMRAAVTALADRSAHWVYVSTVSVYADPAAVGVDESADVVTPLDGDVLSDPADYGRAKVACERILLDGVGETRGHIARPGLIGGPGDRSGRGAYWPWRFAHPASADGRVIVPAATHSAQLVDVRDVAGWLVDAAERRILGVANIAGATTTLTAHLEAAREVAGGRAVAVPVDESWLLDRGVRHWAGPRSLPLWLPAAAVGAGASDTSHAVDLGLRRRPLAETLADTLAWREANPGVDFGAGLSDADELELLAAVAGISGSAAP